MLWVLGIGAVVAVAAVAAVDSNQVPQAAFSCEGRTTGYYADVKSGCQVYHMCDGLGRQFSYTCPNATLFQQRMLICDHWYMVNCSKSVDDYTANLRIGRKMPFVDDSESNPYHRTPRPDLLSHHSQSEYDIIYRTGKAQFGTNLNLVGAESDNRGAVSTTDESTYSLPSHWSTEYNQRGTTLKPKVVFSSKKNFDVGNRIKGKPIIPVGTVTEVPVNFKSSFKATTPVFPKTVEVNSESPDDAGVVPPQVATATEGPVNYKSSFKATTPVFPKIVEVNSENPDDAGVVPPAGAAPTEVPVNYRSSFKATTPVFPKTVELNSENPDEAGVAPPGSHQITGDTVTEVPVNYKSSFKATTPVFPLTVELNTVPPSDAGLVPPLPYQIASSTKTKVNFDSSVDINNDTQPALSLTFQPPAVDTNFDPKERIAQQLPASPSKFYQPPKFSPDYTEETQAPEVRSATVGNNWDNLRKMLLIPEYDFPLESVSRPSYDTVFSSFQARQAPGKK